jgi:hypothetical protein
VTKGNQYTGQLLMGQRVYSGLYGGRHGIIFHIRGEQRPDSVRSLGNGVVAMGGGAFFDVVFDDGTISRGIPEAIVRGVQWEISDQVASPEEIEEALLFAEAEKVKKDDAARRKKEFLEKERRELPGRYPFLTPRDGRISPWALGAKNLRTELSRAFPGVKFRVTSKSYTGGSSIDIHWCDGPISRQVQEIANRYQMGSFDGMTDSYTYNHNPFPNVFGGAKYVFSSRRFSPRLLTIAAERLGLEVGEVSEHEEIKDLSIGQAQEIRRIAQDITLMPESPRKAGKATRTTSSQKKGRRSSGQDALTRMGLR